MGPLGIFHLGIRNRGVTIGRKARGGAHQIRDRPEGQLRSAAHGPVPYTGLTVASATTRA
eukprot:scaffold5320_cov350-Prasinococcus_capsulatus_cf.AAC.7